MKITTTSLADVYLIEPRIFGDARGFFLESYNERVFAEHGLPVHFVQDNHSGSRKGVLRGLHYQIRQPQAKLVRCLRGEIFDVAVDLRRNSPNFGKWFGARLSEENRAMLWIPTGFAHGFSVLSDQAEVAYKATEFYAPEYERSLLWNDPAIGIDWQLDCEPTLSTKDQAGVPLDQADVFEVDVEHAAISI